MLMAAGGALELGSDWTVHLLARVRHLRHVLLSYKDYYNATRTHLY
jgi:hypothetical protein